MGKITARIKREISVFRQLTKDSRLLLFCSGLFWFAGPFIGLFLNIYLWREVSRLEAVALYNLFVFLGLPIGFIINGFLLRRISHKTAFQLGLLLQGVFPIALMILQEKAFNLLSLLGIINGLGAAFYWANMNQLIYDLTSDEIRGYFTGIDSTLSSVLWIFASPLAGFVIGVFGQNWLRLSVRGSYYLSFMIAMLTFFVIAFIAGKITPRREKTEFSFKAISFKNKSKKWANVRLLNIASGFAYGIFSFSFGLLAFSFFGKELTVGWFDGFLGIVSALAAYLAGRYASPTRRIRATIIGVTLFFIGSIFLGINFSLIGFYVFAVLTTTGDTFLWIVHLPIEMREMDRGYLSKKQRYSYWVDIEIFLNLGRVLGITIFIFLTKFFAFEMVYRLIVVIVGLAPLVSLKAIKNLAGD